MTSVTVVDYGMGNLFSVGRALEHVGASVVTVHSPSSIEAADRLILPGVGSFANGMAELKQRGIVDALKSYAASGRPFLGICLGMQLMFEVGEEFGVHRGLGLVDGKVIAMRSETMDKGRLKVPHIGWNELRMPPGRSGWEGTLLGRCTPGDTVYFVHSFTAWPEEEMIRLADSYYGDQRISAAIETGSLMGCQFHPEKSGAVGLRILKRFVEMR